ncbi:MAG: HD domain-containing protein [Phycisphaerales bacterium]|nr:HD domain-containing protein [Phycisphaerales bacterium]MCB9862098.1 HD domain-containing protein [Phycisphaerales bacterium]
MLKELLTPRRNQLFGSPIKSLSDGWFELLLVTIVLAVTLVAHGMLNATHVIVHFYYLPVIIAAHYFGRTLACTIALLSVLTVCAFMLLAPAHYQARFTSPMIAVMTMIAWGGFLGLNALLMGTLSNQRARAMIELREAHVGIIEILSKYLNAADQYTKSHSMRVAELSTSIATQMKLKDDIIEDVRVGALLHDIGKVEISTRLIQKAAELDASERDEMDAHTVRGADLVRSLGTILDGAIPVIKHHHDHYSEDSKQQGLHGEEIPIGARIVSVADAYDAIVTDRPYRRGRTPEEAVTIIRGASGTQFDPKVVAAFEIVISRHNDEADAAIGGGNERTLAVTNVGE